MPWRKCRASQSQKMELMASMDFSGMHDASTTPFKILIRWQESSQHGRQKILAILCADRSLRRHQATKLRRHYHAQSLQGAIQREEHSRSWCGICVEGRLNEKVGRQSKERSHYIGRLGPYASDIATQWHWSYETIETSQHPHPCGSAWCRPEFPRSRICRSHIRM